MSMRHLTICFQKLCASGSTIRVLAILKGILAAEKATLIKGLGKIIYSSSESSVVCRSSIKQHPNKLSQDQ